MIERVSFVALVLLVACDQPPPRDVLVRAGRMDPGDGGADGVDIVARQRIWIREGLVVRIEEDSEPFESPMSTRVVDGRRSLVKPGLADAVVAPPQLGSLRESIALVKAKLTAGVTTLAVLDTDLEVALALRRYVGTARHRGPRIFVSGPRLVVGADATAARRAVQKLAEAQVDVLSLAVTSSEHEAVACVAVDEARQQELRVIAANSRAESLRCPGSDLAPLCPLEGASEDLGCPREVEARSRHNVRALGLDDATGVVRAGFRADMVVMGDAGVVEVVLLDGIVQIRTAPPWHAPMLLLAARAYGP